MPHVRVNGIDLYHDVSGDGPPLLLISGLSGSALDWESIRPTLAQRFTVVTFDNRGAGRSTAPQGPYTVRQMAEDAATLLGHLGVERAHVVGLSLGALIGQELAINHPTLVDRLAMIGAAARVRPKPMGIWLDMWVQVCERGLDPAGIALWLMPWFLTPAFMRNHEQVAAAIDQMLADPFPAPVHGIAGQAAAVRNHDASARLREITAPTLVLVGADDIVTPVADAEALAAGIPGARLLVLPRGGHVPQLEDPDAVWDAVLAFLDAPTPT